MLQIFWQNPFLNLIFIAFLMGSFLREAFPKNNEHPPGLIEGLQVLVNAQRETYQKKIQSIRQKIGLEIPITVEELKSSRLDPEFLKDIFLHTEAKWPSYLQQNDCSFLSLLENDLIKGSTGVVQTVPVITEKGKTFLLSRDQFIETSLKFKCFNNKQISKLFLKKSLKPTLEGLRYPTPKTKAQCDQILDDWRNSPYLPYLCHIPEAIVRGRKAELFLNNSPKATLRLRRDLAPIVKDYRWYVQNIEFFKRNYLKNICRGLTQKSFFCDSYLAKDVWSRIINGEQPQEKLLYKCRNLYRKDKVTFNQLKACASRMTESPQICTTKTSQGFPSLYPRPNCRSISQGLNISHLKTAYHDCPAHIDNLAITNIHRIINHVRPRKIISRPTKCFSEANYTVAQLNIDFKREEGWPLRLCYFDQTESKEDCKLYVPGHLEGDGQKISEEEVIKSILEKTKEMREHQKCKFVSQSQYNPSLLEYKSGCFIIINDKICHNAFCPRKIVFESEIIKDITYKGQTLLSYFPINYTKKEFTAFNMMNEIYKLKQIKIKNLTELEIFLTKHKTGIVHGIGCAERLLPQFFKMKSLNQCTPMPFITDGVLRQDNNKFLVVRTAVDDVHSPRLILWNFVFSGLNGLQEMHPLNLWPLYGIKS